MTLLEEKKIKAYEVLKKIGELTHGVKQLQLQLQQLEQEIIQEEKK